MDTITFEIKEFLGVLETKASGWNKEVNIVSWNGGEPKLDIRDWDPDHVRMSRGITLQEELAVELARILANKYGAK